MKENIIIFSCTDLGNDRLHIVGKNEKKEIECFYTDKNMIPDYYLVCKGDKLIIEFDEKERGVKTIKGVEKWRISKMNERLIKIIDECIAERQKKISELNAFLGKYELSEAGIKNAREKMAEELKKYISGKVTEIQRLFEEKIKQLDDEEQREIEKKNNSLEFQQIMHKKAGILKLFDCAKIEGHVLENYLKEFQNYPVAVELFRSICINKENYAAVIEHLPGDTRGERQDRMKKSKADVTACLEGLVEFETRGNNSQIAMIESCKSYIEHQAEDFSIPSEVVWGSMNNANVQNIKNISG